MNPFTVETKFFRNNSNNSDIVSNSSSGAGPGVGIIRSEIKENNVILYRISREAIQGFSTNPSVDNCDLKPELNRNGIVLFINKDDSTVQIKQAENIFDSLVASTTADEAADAMSEATPDMALDTPETADDEEADTVVEIAPETADTIETTETVDDSAVTVETASTASTVAEENAAEEGMLWNTAIVVLCGSSLNTRVQFLPSLYDKAVEKIVKAGRYELISSPSASPVSSVSSALSESSVSSISSEAEDIGESANTANSVDTEGSAEETVAAEADTEFDFIIFLIGYLLRCDVFVPSSRNNHSNTDATDSIHGDLTGTTLYLTNKNKNVSATGILTQGAKRILVKAGSTISSDNRLPSQKGQASSAALREKLIDDRVIVEGQFASDYDFTSTSAAASVILGQSASGMNTWKDEAGRKLETLLGR